MSPLDRRGFLGAVAGAVVASTARLDRFGRTSVGAPGAVPAGVPALASYFGDPVAAARIGFAYLAIAPAEGDADLLLAELAPAGTVPTEWWTTVTLEELQDTIRDAVHADFEAGDVVDLAGWQLARTEARLTALSMLL